MSVQNSAKSQFENVDWNIKNKSTNIMGKIFAALVIITAVGGLLVLTAHGAPAAIGTAGSDILVFGGGAAGFAGLIFGGLKIRDWREKKQAEIAWSKHAEGMKDMYANDLAALRQNGSNMELTQQIALNGQTYYLHAVKGANKVKIYKNK
jgi:hypothetical protein